MTAPMGPPPDHRVGRQDRLLVFLRGATAVTMLAAVIGMVWPGSVGRIAANIVVIVLIAVPGVRVVWLIQRWARKRDWRYVSIAAVLLVIVSAAPFVG